MLRPSPTISHGAPLMKSRSLRLGGAAACLAFASCAAVAAPPAPMLGFSPADAEAQRALEAKFDAALSPAEISARLKLMSAEANQVGSPHDKANAEFTLAQYKAWG